MRRIFNGNFKVTQKYHSGHIGMDIVGLSSKNIVSPVEGVVKTSTWVSKQADPLTWEWGNYVRVSGHIGMDIVGLSSKNIVSPVEGVVKTSTWVSKQADPLTWEWGNYVRVDDAQGNRYFFCHMASRAVSVGQRVQVGTKLGVMGNTGYSFGAHCHFEVRRVQFRRPLPL